MDFARSAARLAGLAGVLLHWRPDTFWSATPEDLAVVLAALASDAAEPPPDGAVIERLKEQFPDGG